MSKKCTASGIYASLEWCPGQTVLPGIRPAVYVAPKSWITTWPTLPITAEGATMGDLVKYKGNFTMALDKKWIKIDAFTKKSSFSCESQGEDPSKTFLNKVSLFYPGTDEDASGFCRQANVDQLVFLVFQRDGKCRVFGSEFFDSAIKPSLSSGEGDTGTGGTTIEIECTDLCPAPFYPGEIVVDGGKISGADGTVLGE